MLIMFVLSACNKHNNISSCKNEIKIRHKKTDYVAYNYSKISKEENKIRRNIAKIEQKQVKDNEAVDADVFVSLETDDIAKIDKNPVQTRILEAQRKAKEKAFTSFNVSSSSDSKKWHTLSIIGFILSFLGPLGIVGIILCIISLFQLANKKDMFKGKALAFVPVALLTAFFLTLAMVSLSLGWMFDFTVFIIASLVFGSFLAYYLIK